MKPSRDGTMGFGVADDSFDGDGFDGGPVERRTRFGVLATPETEISGRANCNHPQGRRREGERQPARWGSWPTEECTMCGAWRAAGFPVGHGAPGPWNAASVPRNDEDDDV